MANNSKKKKKELKLTDKKNYKIRLNAKVKKLLAEIRPKRPGIRNKVEVFVEVFIINNN